MVFRNIQSKKCGFYTLFLAKIDYTLKHPCGALHYLRPANYTSLLNIND